MGRQAIEEPDLRGLQAAVLAFSRAIARRRRRTTTVAVILATVAVIGGVAGYWSLGGAGAPSDRTQGATHTTQPLPGDDSAIQPNRVKSVRINPHEYGSQLATAARTGDSPAPAGTPLREGKKIRTYTVHATPVLPDSPEGKGLPRPASPLVPVDAAAKSAEPASLHEEDPKNPNGRLYSGSALWRTEPVTLADGTR